jgi:hypothetical protein
MSTFREDIKSAAGGEKIIGIVIGDMGWGNYNSEGKPAWVKGELLKWKDTKEMLDYEYDDGYGSPDCQAITAWTKTKVIFVVQYDGSTSVWAIPRNPIAHMPEMPGG